MVCFCKVRYGRSGALRQGELCGVPVVSVGVWQVRCVKVRCGGFWHGPMRLDWVWQVGCVVFRCVLLRLVPFRCGRYGLVDIGMLC